ncbi:MAG TPA: hypothetical protein DEH78_08645 [Solibacterales bacterium]|nr:hypothetical protein [Bryobacterales bacterium]
MRHVFEAIEQFLAAAREPVLLEPGALPLPLTPDTYLLEVDDRRMLLQAWDSQRNLTRRIAAVGEQQPGRLELKYEGFGKKGGTLVLADLAHRSGDVQRRRSDRHAFREVFRRQMLRQFPGWRVAELSAEADLHHSLSPAYPRAVLRKGSGAWAAIGASPESHSPEAALTFGLIWLDYLRRREPKLHVGGLALFLPDGRTRVTAQRLRWLDEGKAKYLLFSCGEHGEHVVDPRDCGNLETDLAPAASPVAAIEDPLARRIAGLSDVEALGRGDSVSFRVRGLEFARYHLGRISFGVDAKRAARERHFDEIAGLARTVALARHAEAGDRRHPFFRKSPELWLECMVRRDLETVSASLRRDLLYGQVPAFAGGDRDLLDLLGVDTEGRLAVIELKAGSDPHLPLQALDYWMRVAWHAGRGEFRARGYFPAVELRAEPPRLFLVSPALEFHPSTETVVSFLRPEIELERVGLGIEWRRQLRVVFRARGAASPVWQAGQECMHGEECVDGPPVRALHVESLGGEAGGGAAGSHRPGG